MVYYLAQAYSYEDGRNHENSKNNHLNKNYLFMGGSTCTGASRPSPVGNATGSSPHVPAFKFSFLVSSNDSSLIDCRGESSLKKEANSSFNKV